MRVAGQQVTSTTQASLVDRAARLFEFLGRVQQLKSPPPRTVSAYRSVLWFEDLPLHGAVQSGHRGGDPESEDDLLAVDRVPRLAPPEVEQHLGPWLDGAVDDPDRAPVLRDSLPGQELDDSGAEAGGPPPEIVVGYEQWLARWQTWAEQELRDRPVRALYGELFSVYLNLTSHAEEFELVVGVGCLAWSPQGHSAVRRHLLTVPVTIQFDDDSGRITVQRFDSADAVKVELDMLDPALINNPAYVNEVRETARVLESHPLHRDAVGSLARRLVHILDADGAYLDVDRAPEPALHANVAFAPAIILRKRSGQGLVDIYNTIVGHLRDGDEVPAGIRPLVDPDHRPPTSTDPAEGALVVVDDDPFLPLPVNDVQLRILRQVDTKAQTLVQGPPGTGKTHTAAALLSHLLAQGKRVLVTAHTDRALKEVRDKLPDAIKPLAVAVVGSSREDMSDLRVAVERIAAMAAEHDPEGARTTVDGHRAAIDRLRQERAKLYQQLLAARQHEVRQHQYAGYHGTLAGIAQQLEAESDRYGWLLEHLTDIDRPDAPLSTAEALEWHGHLCEKVLASDEPEALQRLVDRTTLPTPDRFADLVAAEQTAMQAAQQHRYLREHPAFVPVGRLDPPARDALRQRFLHFAEQIGELTRRREPWLPDALADVLAGRARTWRGRAGHIGELIGQARPLVERIGPVTQVRVSGENVGALVALAEAVRPLVEGGRVKTDAAGMPKIGALSAKPIKSAQPLFERVSVDGLPPTSAARIHTFLGWAEATRLLDALDRAWPGQPAPVEDTLHERLDQHETEFELLRRVLGLGEALAAEERWLATAGLPRPDWTDVAAIRTYASVVNATAAVDRVAAATAPVQQLEAWVSDTARWSDAAAAVHRLHLAVRQRNHEEYSAGYHRLQRLEHVRRLLARRDMLGAQLGAAARPLLEAIEQDPRAARWVPRLRDFEHAWAWAATNSWIGCQTAADVNHLQAEVSFIEKRIRNHVEQLAATRAWTHAVSENRLTGQARADLEQYAYLVKRLGKGKTRYLAERKADIRHAMDRCRPAVPVWIMPIYRIADQLRIQPNMFDVIVVDEASQAGLEAVFLQYMAPKIVVIGDDKQVSPAAVGVDQQQLRDLAGQYLADDPYRASWQDPQRSLFDEAKMRFGGLLTLVEHRRCVPEIIGFSNRIAYEPDGIRLIPVRQYGADRLEPIKAVFLENGYSRGTTNRINPVEAQAIVDQVEKCIADPRYDGLTFGVISLLGKAQASHIERLLLERVDAKELVARDLRCGDSADFQGSERNVIFLSMVAAPEPGHRLGALTAAMYVQRYNVAASRAKDQMWVFHSVRPSELGNKEDMRFQLLDYCYGVINRLQGEQDGVPAGPVSEDQRVDPFDSLFEQRVYNRLVDRGYTVVPQYPVEPYKIDLVVLGGQRRLAIECDGDAWHGPESHHRDLARQRDLERCGWRFFRIRESAFYLDQQAVLAELWTTLSDLGIRPSSWLDEQDLVPDLVAAPPASEVLDEPSAVLTTAPPAEPPPGLAEPTILSPAEPVASLATEPTSEVIANEPVWPTVDDEMPDVMTFESAAHDTADRALEPDPRPVGRAYPAIPPYRPFTGVLVTALTGTKPQLVNGVVAIVEVEGPVMGQRLHAAYVRASGGHRVGKLIATALNSAITAAVRKGLLVQDSPLGEQGVKPRTYRTPDQPPELVRQIGPRSFDEIPPRELAALLVLVAEEHGWADQEQLFRAALDRLGFKRLTPNVKQRFQAVLGLTRADH